MQKDFEAFIGQGEQAQGGHGGLPRRRLSVCGWKEGKEKKRKCEEFFSSCVCKNQAWKGCVQESSMERMCVRIKHEKNLCSKYLLLSGLLF